MRFLSLISLSVLLISCIEPLAEPSSSALSTLSIGQSRTIELRALRLDVENFQQTLTLDDLKKLPKTTLEELWLVDLELLPLVTNSLEQLLEADPSTLDLPSQNMQRLLRLSPNDIDFSQTQLEELLALSGSIGVAPARAIADLLQIDRAASVVPLDVAAKVLTKGLITSHPSGQLRHGKVDTEHPDGLYPVTPGTIPVTLADVVNQFSNLTEKFGPVDLPNGTRHPGFIDEASGFTVIEDKFAMTVKVNLNALPYKGVDLTDASIASVNSLGSQIDNIFDTSDPDWLRVEGMVPEPGIERLTVRVNENPQFIASGTDREPQPNGNGRAWTLPGWEFEQLIVKMAKITTERLRPDCLEYTLGANTVVFRACVDDTGWTTFETFNNVGNPPAASYLWDIQLNMAQVRLHDGGLAEGMANVAFSITDVAVGVTSATLIERIKTNFAQNPRALRDLASAANETTVGAADFYYFSAKPGAPADQAGDWLFFITPNDIPRAENGDPIRPYAYSSPGFFRDEGLSQSAASNALVEGDTEHLKVRIAAGDVLYTADDTGAVYRLTIGQKKGPRTLVMTVARVR